MHPGPIRPHKHVFSWASEPFTGTSIFSLFPSPETARNRLSRYPPSGPSFVLRKHPQNCAILSARVFSFFSLVFSQIFPFFLSPSLLRVSLPVVSQVFSPEYSGTGFVRFPSLTASYVRRIGVLDLFPHQTPLSFMCRTSNTPPLSFLFSCPNLSLPFFFSPSDHV